ncbi:MAG TPA: hypothetical protein VGR96_19520 [Acidobacteriaceae bacterium]|nr:hypothetical protein [Acidobacteriaceae bacterium]
MTLEQFLLSLEDPQPPPGLAPLLAALWWDGKGDWDRGHEIAQEEGDRGNARAAAWVHAYLHRKEGDAANAGYWYRRAGQPQPKGPLEEEWRQIAGALLEEPPSSGS